MPIDPNISLQVNPVQVQDPYQAYGRMMSLKNLVNAGKLDQIQLREAQMREQQQQRDLTDDEVVRQVFGQLKGDYTKLPEGVAGKVSQQRQLAIIKLVDDWEKERQARGKEEWEGRLKKADRLGALAATVNDQDTFNRALQAAFEEGLIPQEQMASWLQKDWNDPQVQAEVKQTAMASQTGRQIYEHGVKMFEEERKQGDQSRQNQQFMETQYQANRTAHRLENPRSTPVTRTTNLGTFIIDPAEATAQEVRAPGGQPITNQAAGGEGPTAQQRFDWTKSEAGKDALNTGRKEHDELQTEEQKLHSQKIEIGEAVRRLERAAEWKDEKDVNGKVRRVRDPDATYKGIDGKDYEASDEQRRLLEQKLANADREIADLQRRQKNIREQLGVGEFGRQAGTAPLAEVLRNPEAAVAPAQVPQPPAPAPAKPVTPPKPAAKAFPRARLASFAQANRMTEQQAEAELKKQGYTLN